jgi:3-oxoadipate enol-lactonase
MESGYVDIKGQKLYYEIEGQGEDLLLISGLGQDVTGWAFQVPRYALYYRVITFDNRDVGRSGDATGPYKVGDMAEDAAALMDALGINRAYVLGYSMGGAIAQELALRHPEKVRKLILASTTAQLGRYKISIFEPMKFIREQDPDGKIMVNLQLFMVMTREFLKLKRATEMMAEMLLHPPFPQSGEGFARQIDANRSFDTLDRLHSVKAPTLVLVGDQDILTTPWEAKELADAIPGARFQILEDGGHGLVFEIPEKFNKAVVDFLRS